MAVLDFVESDDGGGRVRSSTRCRMRPLRCTADAVASSSRGQSPSAPFQRTRLIRNAAKVSESPPHATASTSARMAGLGLGLQFGTRRASLSGRDFTTAVCFFMVVLNLRT